MAYLRTTLNLSLALASLVAIVPNAAEACSPDPCWFDYKWLDSIAPVNHAEVPADGVLVLQGVLGGIASLDLAAQLGITVTRDGQPVAGALANAELPGVVVWRPDGPLIAGATYQVSGAFNNSADPVELGCAEQVLALEFEFTAVDAAEPLAAPQVAAEAAIKLDPSQSLGDLVCCDGAIPYTYDCAPGPEWGQGACAPNKGVGFLQVQVDATSPLAPATAGLLATVVRIDGEEVARGLQPSFSIRLDSPACIVVEQVSLASGETIAAAEQCVGQEFTDQLGLQILDPVAALEGQCSGPLYTCELLDGAWDENDCHDLEDEPPPVESESDSDSEGEPTTSVSESDGESSGDSASSGTGEPEPSSDSDDPSGDDKVVGCGCNSTTADPTALLGLLALGAVIRRRRR